MSVDGRAERQRLAQDIARFNFSPAAYVHKRWLSELEHADELLACIDCERSERNVSEYLLDALALRGRYTFQFDDPVTRLALLEAEKLQELAFHAGLTLNTSRIRHAITRELVQSMKNALGEAAYMFALRRASFISTPIMICEPQDTERSFRADPRDIVERTGVACLALALEGQPVALTRRVELKLPTSFDTAGIALSGNCEQAGSLLNRLRREVAL